MTPTSRAIASFKLENECLQRRVAELERSETVARQAEKVLRQSEERLSKAFHASPIGLIISTESDGRIVDVNQAYCLMVGYLREEIIGKQTTELNLYPNPVDHQQLVQTLQQTGQLYNAEVQYRTHSGQVRTLLTSMIPIELQGEEPCIISFALDFTGRKQAEEEIKSLARLPGENPEPMLRIRQDGILLYANPPGEVLLRNYGCQVGKHAPKDWKALLSETFASQVGKVFEVQLEERTWSFFLVPIIDQGYLNMYGSDITERKRAEERLKQALERLDLATWVSRIGVWDRNIPKNEMVWDDRMYELFGVHKEDFSSAFEVWMKGVHPDDRAQMDEIFQQSMLGEREYEAEFRVVWPDGTLHYLKTNGYFVRNGDRKPLRLIGVNQDITQRKQAEIQIERQLDRLTALRSIDMLITSSSGLVFTLNYLIELAAKNLAVDAAAIQLLKTHAYELEYTAGCGFRSNAYQITPIRLGEGYAGRVALEHRSIYLPDLFQADEHLRPDSWLEKEGFAAYFGTPLTVKGQVKGVFEVFHRTALHPDHEWIDFLETLTSQTAIAIDNLEMFEGLQRSNIDLRNAYDSTLEGWSQALDMRDKETEGHSQRVTEMTVRLSQGMGLSQQELVHVHRGALLHDIGKLGIPDSILLKPGALTDEEWVMMRRHPLYAFEWLSPIDYLRPALEIPYCHHEKWDGSGYPRGLKGESIPLAARIFAIVDVWDALRHDGPSRPAWSEAMARKFILEQSGKHFDPQVVNAFIQLIDEEGSAGG